MYMDIDDSRNFNILRISYCTNSFKNPDMLFKDTKMIFNLRNIIYENFAMFCVNDYGINQSKSKS